MTVCLFKTSAMAGAIYLLLCLSLCYTCEAYKALVVFPMPSKSHSILGDGIVRNLLKDGVEVTYITGFGYKNAPSNLRLIDVSSNAEVFPQEIVDLKKLLEKKGSSVDFKAISILLTNVISHTLNNENVAKLLNDPHEQFDVLVAEWMFSDILSGLAPVFNCPLIVVYSIEVNAGSISLVDIEPNPAYSGSVHTEYSPPFTFVERVKELFSRIIFRYIKYLYFEGLEAEHYEKLIVPIIKKRGHVAPSYYDMRYNASLVLGNSHVSLGIALPLPQNYKAIGGYHIDDELKPLPQDLQKIMDDSKDGVIYFSMGSNLKSKDWPEEIKRDLLKMFGGLKQTVLWKFEEKLADVPKNVHILKWAPQPSILSHPNLLLFISHGGFLSTTETIYYGVPIIGIPVYGDQSTNVKRSVKKGFAVEVELSYDIAKDLKPAIDEMINNPKYRQKAKELSFIFHDRPMKPGAEVAHWVRHVVNTRGALHLRSPSHRMPLYKLLYLDLVALIVLLLVIAIVSIRYICSVVCQKNNKGKQKKN